MRNARKSPHKTLKTLVEILDKAQQHIQPRGYCTSFKPQVHQEIQRIDRLNQARLERFWTHWEEHARQFFAIEGVTTSMALLAMHSDRSFKRGEETSGL